MYNINLTKASVNQLLAVCKINIQAISGYPIMDNTHLPMSGLSADQLGQTSYIFIFITVSTRGTAILSDCLVSVFVSDMLPMHQYHVITLRKYIYLAFCLWFHT